MSNDTQAMWPVESGAPDCSEAGHLDENELRRDHGHIEFDGLPNTRDLGGLETADGRHVRSGVLLRSGMLCSASDEDIARLRDDYRLRAIVDLRGDEELAELPDPVGEFPGLRYVHADVMKQGFAGISQDEESRRLMAKLEEKSVDDPPAFMEGLYPGLFLRDAGVEAYRAFMRTILECEDGAVLWHCHVGRDRCGMASLLVEHVLGVPMEISEDDYLATNIYTDEPSTRRTEANLRFIRAAVGAVEREWGGLDGYVHDALGVSDADVAELRARYLV